MIVAFKVTLGITTDLFSLKFFMSNLKTGPITLIRLSSENVAAYIATFEIGVADTL